MLSVQHRFNHASQTYDNVASVQKISARKLCEMVMDVHPPLSYSSVLDLGAGTGSMTEVLHPFLPKSTFTLVDFAPNMLERAAIKLQHHANIRYQCADFSTSSFDFHELIVSNLAFQWVDDWQDLIKKMIQNTDLLAFSCLLAGSFDAWYQMVDKEYPETLKPAYPTEQAIGSFLETLHAEVVMFFDDYPLSFSNPYELMRYFKALGASKGNHQLSLKKLRNIIAHDAPIEVSYRIFYGVIRPWSL